MNRRGFLGFLAGVASTAVLDPERLLWVPGAKLISIPAPVVVPQFIGEPHWSVAPVLNGELKDWFERFTGEYFAAETEGERLRTLDRYCAGRWDSLAQGCGPAAAGGKS